MQNYIGVQYPHGTTLQKPDTMESHLKARLNSAFKQGDVAYLEQQNHPEANNLLGQLYLRGYKSSTVTIEQDDSKAVSYFIKGADEHHSAAKETLFSMLVAGRGIDDQNRPRALEYLEKASVEYGNSMSGTEARYQLASQLKATNPAKAVLFFQKVVQASSATDSYIQIINLLCSSDQAKNGLDKSDVEDYLKDGANRMKRADAMYTYADHLCSMNEHRILRDGIFGSPQETALPYYEKAANAGDKVALVKALKIKAEIKGDAESAFKLGQAFLDDNNNLGVLKDLTEAKKYLTIASEKGYVLATNLLKTTINL